jgi:site-specific DNA-methyltransferase (adenine-specific)
MIKRGKQGDVGGILATELAGDGKIFKDNNITFEEYVPELYRVLKEETHCYIMINWNNLNKLINVAKKSGFKLQNILVWKKQNCTPSRWYMKNNEFIVMFRKGKAKAINNPGTKAILEFDNIIRNKKHPTQKPIKLLKTLILNSTQKGETVLDPFMGSGSTAIASLLTDRDFIGFEINQKYVDVSNKRLGQLDSKYNDQLSSDEKPKQIGLF